MININDIIFDLDGTLIDSSTGILSTLKKVLDNEKLAPKRAYDSSLIGPPLGTILSKLSGVDDSQLLNKMIQHFKKEYDEVGYKLSEPYSGIDEMLRLLKKNKIDMHIATNKRLLPTNKIIEYLGWNDFFVTVYSIDSRTPSYENKAQILGAQVQKNHIIVDSLLYIGDKKEDGYAAEINHIKFIKANWGFNDFFGQNIPEIYFQADSPIEILNLILGYEKRK